MSCFSDHSYSRFAPLWARICHSCWPLQSRYPRLCPTTNDRSRSLSALCCLRLIQTPPYQTPLDPPLRHNSRSSFSNPRCRHSPHYSPLSLPHLHPQNDHLLCIQYPKSQVHDLGISPSLLLHSLTEDQDPLLPSSNSWIAKTHLPPCND